MLKRKTSVKQVHCHFRVGYPLWARQLPGGAFYIWQSTHLLKTVEITQAQNGEDLRVSGPGDLQIPSPWPHEELQIKWVPKDQKKSRVMNAVMAELSFRPGRYCRGQVGLHLILEGWTYPIVRAESINESWRIWICMRPDSTATACLTRARCQSSGRNRPMAPLTLCKNRNSCKSQP
jgi:hypothetical protein